MPGTLFIVAAPSGAGKTSLVKALLEREPDIALSISHTTRPPRPGEIEGRHYHYVSNSEFEQLVEQNAFLEHAVVFGHRYGTSRMAVETQLATGHDILLEIDFQGAAQVCARMPCCSIFILPPSRQELLRRLRRRGQDSETEITRRTREARAEMLHHTEFDYLVINDNFETALNELRAIVTAQRLRRSQQTQCYAALIADLLKEA